MLFLRQVFAKAGELPGYNFRLLVIIMYIVKYGDVEDSLLFSRACQT